MNREKIKEEIVKDGQQQTNIIINAQFSALYTQLIKKGILAISDIDEMDKLTKEYIEKLNEKLVDKVIEEMEKYND